jgi:hypothetical protein
MSEPVLLNKKCGRGKAEFMRHEKGKFSDSMFLEEEDYRDSTDQEHRVVYRYERYFNGLKF